METDTHGWSMGEDREEHRTYDDEVDLASSPPVPTHARPQHASATSVSRRSMHAEEEDEWTPHAKHSSAAAAAATEPLLQRVDTFQIHARNHPRHPLSAPLLIQPAALHGITLRQHQLAGVNWLKEHYEMGVHAILADEMGLGKTLTTLSFLSWLLSQQSSSSSSFQPTLILAPLSLMQTWRDEMDRCCPLLRYRVYCGDKTAREEAQVELCTEMKQWKKQPSISTAPFHVLLTSYEIYMKDADFLARFPWHALCVDEAHRLKNSQSQLFQLLIKQKKFHFKLLLTGTPVQNSLDELW